MDGFLPWLADNVVELVAVFLGVITLGGFAGFRKWVQAGREKQDLINELESRKKSWEDMRTQRDDAWKRLKQVDPRSFLEKLEEARADRAFDYERQLAQEFLTARSPAIAEAARILAEDRIMADAEAEDTILEALRYVTLGLTARPHHQRLNALHRELSTVKRRYEAGAGPASRPLEGLSSLELNQLSLKLDRAGRYAAAELAARRCADMVYAAEGRSVNFAKVIGQHANLLKALGQFDEAEKLLRQAKAIQAKELGTDHPDYATSLGNLASVLHYLMATDEAKSLLRQAKAIRAKKLGTDHPDYAQTLNNLASVLRETGETDEAKKLLRQAKAIQAEKLGTDHPDYAQTLNNLASVLRETGETDEAKKLLRQAKAIQAEKLGTDHPDYAQTLNNLAGLLHDKGDTAEAETLLRQAMAIQAEKLGTDHPNYATTLNNIALVLHDKGETAEARALANDAEAILTAKLGPDHALTQSATSIRASIEAPPG